jgi:uncharacterized protein
MIWRSASWRRPAGIETLLRADLGISLLVNNAGVGAVGPLLESDVDKMDDMIALNVRALTRLTYATVPGFVRAGAARSSTSHPAAASRRKF